ncbi:MAG TPA: type II toxin-antitoxin system VapC family toxin [Terriglobales bacterium]|nr:type II toxin-antitoxin system VapC family toxin [Terriglobales bacterium]
MKLLLDTHIWVWSVLEPERLSSRMANAIADSGTELWLSPISVWEVIVLHRKGRLLPEVDLAGWIARAMRALSVKEAPVTHEVAQEIGRLELSHRDPADHFLVATAKVFDLTLATADEKLLKVKGISILRNRA